MKNWMGIMGGARSRIHQRLDESLVDISMSVKPTLTILDAVRILTANGPQGGSLNDVKKLNTVIAGIDQVAVDSFGATLFGMKGGDLGYVRLGAQSGLGVMDLSKLNIQRYLPEQDENAGSFTGTVPAPLPFLFSNRIKGLDEQAGEDIP
jgi:uncharacterized protein (DUF362 family)